MLGTLLKAAEADKPRANGHVTEDAFAASDLRPRVLEIRIEGQMLRSSTGTVYILEGERTMVMAQAERQVRCV